MTTDDTLPTFIVIGTMKGGTTALHTYLAGHPDVFMSEPKELDFFVGGPQWKAGADWYRSMFHDASGALARGESSPNYSKYPTIPDVPERMATLIPDVRLIYILRHPLERTVAHYLHFRSRGNEDRSAEKAIREDPRYVNASLYAQQVEQFLSVFPRDQLLLVRSEDLRASARDALAAITRFIGVREDWAPSDTVDAHRSDRRRVPRRGVGPLYRTELGHRALRSSPSGLAGFGHRAATVPATAAHARLTPSTTATLLARFRDDLDHLRDRFAPDFSGWDLSK